MKRRYSITQRFLFLCALLLAFCFLSCKKEATKPVQPTVNPPGANAHKVTDSASYTLDGITYTCDLINGEEGANAGANLDTSNNGWKYDADTLQYTRSFDFATSATFNGPNPGTLKILFAKKFAKSQLVSNRHPGIKSPVSDTLLYYPKGGRPYAVDYNRFNSQDGIALAVIGRTGSATSWLFSYCYQSARLPTTITNDSQKNATFEITDFYKLPTGEHILEAKFTANFFDRGEKPIRAEKGYVRIHVD